MSVIFSGTNTSRVWDISYDRLEVQNDYELENNFFIILAF